MPGRIAKGTLNLLAGESAVGKTFLALDLALGVAARGLAWGGMEIPRGRVLYLCLDASPVTLSRHMIGLCRQYAIDPPADLLFDFDRHDLSDPREIAFITSQVAERGLSLVILDVLARYLDALNENTAAAISRLMISLRRVASDSGASFLFIHHFNKQRSTRTTVGERVRGSSDLIASMDGVLSATRRVGRMDLRPVKNRLGVDAAPLSYRISAQQDGSPCLEFIADDAQPDLAETIVEVAREQVVRMLRILHGHFYPRTAIEEMLAEHYGLPGKMTLDEVFAKLGSEDGIQVKVEHRNKKYYGYIEKPGEELPDGEEVTEDADAVFDGLDENLARLVERFKQKVKQKAMTRGDGEAGKLVS